MIPRRPVLDPDPLNRRVLLAVELLEPITDAILWKGFTVDATGLKGQHRISASGRFVWLIEGDAWPTAITVTSDDPAYESQTVTPPVPQDVHELEPAERLVRVRLRPTSAYPVDAGVTAIRGRLVESAVDPTPVVGARVQLAWHPATGGAWEPAPPDAPAPGAATPREPETNADGRFLALLRTPPTKPDVDTGFIKVRLQFTRETPAHRTRVTSADYAFVANHPGRVPEGRLLDGDQTLRWLELDDF